MAMGEKGTEDEILWSHVQGEGVGCCGRGSWCGGMAMHRGEPAASASGSGHGAAELEMVDVGRSVTTP